MLTGALLSSVQSAPPAGWTTCGGLPDALANVACPSTATCARQMWSPSQGNWGCVDGVGAVSCGDYTACPAGTTCVNNGSSWRVISTCVSTATPPAPNVTGVQVCKQGAPLPPSSGLKNVLIIGDSVSIGYTPYVNAALADVALVQHSPWGGDGGAEETAYGAQCIDYLTRAPDGTPLAADVLYFNWGLHNTGTTSLPGQSGPASAYAPFLAKIVAALQANAAMEKLVFGITSPVLNSVASDAVVMQLNAQAQAIMDGAGIPTVDMHAPIIAKCGPVPQASCFNQTGCWSPHCPPGYAWLANSTIAPAIRKALSGLPEAAAASLAS